MTPSEWQRASTLTAVRVIYGELTDIPSRGLTLQTKWLGKLREPQASSIDIPTEQVSRLCLFKVNMSADGSLEAHIMHKGDVMYVHADMGIYCAYRSPISDVLEYHQAPVDSRSYDLVDTVIALKSRTADARLVELGVYCSASLEILHPVTLRQITNVTIRPKEQPRAESIEWKIVNPHVIERGHARNRQKRLAWELREQNGRGSGPAHGLPWSKTTGPFSYFTVCSQERELGRAYCSEFCLQEDDFGKAEQNDQDAEVEVIVRGRLFGGGEVSSDPVSISLDWVVL